MKTYITYGAIGTIGVALLNLALFFTGYQTEKLATGQYLAMIGYIIFIAILVLGMREVRDSKPDKALSYGQCVLAALMISLFYGLFSAVYTYIHLSFINTNFAQYTMDLMRTNLQEKNVPDSQIEAIVSMQTKWMTPVFLSVMTVVMSVFGGTIFGLIIAIFVKQKPPVDPIKAA